MKISGGGGGGGNNEDVDEDDSNVVVVFRTPPDPVFVKSCDPPFDASDAPPLSDGEKLIGRAPCGSSRFGFVVDPFGPVLVGP